VSARDILEALEREIRMLEQQARLAAQLRDRASNDEEKVLQEAARQELLQKAQAVRKSIEQIRKGKP
jgi:hypothetical protein